MKKYLLSLLMFVGLFALSGCGGGTGGSDNISDGGTEGTALLDITAGQMLIDDNNFTLEIDILKNVDESYQISLSDFDLSTDDCDLNLSSIIYNPTEPLEMDFGAGISRTLKISGSFLPPECTGTNYLFTMTRTAVQGGQTDIKTLYVTGSSVRIKNGYELIPITPLEITESSTEYNMSVQVSLNDSVAANEDVSIAVSSFDPNAGYGTIANYNATTDDNGFAIFKYTSPDTLPASGTIIPVTVVHSDGNGTDIEAIIELAFNQKDYSGYTLEVNPAEINISTAGTSRGIVVYVGDEDGPAAGEVVKVNYFASEENGTMTGDSDGGNFYQAVTDINGHVSFEYTAPDNIVVGDQTIITFSLEDNDSINGSTTVNFVAATGTDYSNYELVAFPSEINITEDGASRVIDVYVGNDGSPVANELVTVDFGFVLDGNGTMNSYTGTTDALGHVAFNYTAPTPILIGTQTVLTMRLDGNNSINDSTTVNFTEVDTSVDYSNYTLTVLPSEINITTDGEERVLEVFVGNNNQPAANEIVTVDFNITANGHGVMNSYTGTTNVNGYVFFNYTAPADISELVINDVNDTITISLDGNTSINSDTTVNFVTAEPTNTDDYVLIAAPDEINITLAGESRELNLYLYDTITSDPVGEQEIKALFFNPNNGVMNTYTGNTNINGHVVFTYTAPANLPDTNLTITFKIADDVTDTQDENVTVNFTPAENYNLKYETTPILITNGGQIEFVSVYLVDENDIGVAGQSVFITAINSAYGEFIPSEAITSPTGKATFTFTANSDLTDLNGTSEWATLSYTQNGVTITKAVEIMIADTVSTSSYALVNGAEITVDEYNATRTIDIQLTNNDIPVIDARLCDTLNTITTDCVIYESLDRSVGRITEYSFDPLFDGYIYFSYLGPNETDFGTDDAYTLNVHYIDSDGSIAASGTAVINLIAP